MNQLQLMSQWIEINTQIKNCKRILERYPDDIFYITELQWLEKREVRLKIEVDKIKAISEEDVIIQ
jgi:hypothetical protein